jgi:hypothetical protein
MRVSFWQRAQFVSPHCWAWFRGDRLSSSLPCSFGGLIAGRVGSLAINRGFAGYTSTILALYVIDASGLVLALAAIAFDKTPATG